MPRQPGEITRVRLRRPWGLSESDGHLYGAAILDLPQFDAKATAVYAETMDLKYAERD
jgi:hypothetical protein